MGGTAPTAGTAVGMIGSSCTRMCSRRYGATKSSMAALHGTLWSSAQALVREEGRGGGVVGQIRVQGQGRFQLSEECTLCLPPP